LAEFNFLESQILLVG